MTPLYLLCTGLWAWAVLASAARRRWRAEAEMLGRKLVIERGLCREWAASASRSQQRAAYAHDAARWYRAQAERWHDEARQTRQQTERHHYTFCDN